MPFLDLLKQCIGSSVFPALFFNVSFVLSFVFPLFLLFLVVGRLVFGWLVVCRLVGWVVGGLGVCVVCCVFCIVLYCVVLCVGCCVVLCFVLLICYFVLC